MRAPKNPFAPARARSGASVVRGKERTSSARTGGPRPAPAPPPRRRPRGRSLAAASHRGSPPPLLLPLADHVRLLRRDDSGHDLVDPDLLRHRLRPLTRIARYHDHGEAASLE